MVFLDISDIERILETKEREKLGNIKGKRNKKSVCCGANLLKTNAKKTFGFEIVLCSKCRKVKHVSRKLPTLEQKKEFWLMIDTIQDEKMNQHLKDVAFNYYVKEDEAKDDEDDEDDEYNPCLSCDKKNCNDREEE